MLIFLVVTYKSLKIMVGVESVFISGVRIQRLIGVISAIFGKPRWNGETAYFPNCFFFPDYFRSNLPERIPQFKYLLWPHVTVPGWLDGRISFFRRVAFLLLLGTGPDPRIFLMQPVGWR